MMPTGTRLEPDDCQRCKQMLRFTVPDLMLAAALLAVHFTVAKLAVVSGDYGVFYIALLFPSLLTALVHWRFRLSWQTAMGAHYPIAVVWSFLFGVTCSFYWQQLSSDFFDRQTIGLEHPIGFGLTAAKVMVFVAALSTLAYGCVTYRLCRSIRHEDG